MKWLHNLLKGLSLTTALFIFQACYGTPKGLETEYMVFKVVAADTGEPMEGVNVRTKVHGANGSLEWGNGSLTGASGETGVQILRKDISAAGLEFRFEPADDTYLVKDTTIADFQPRLIEIQLAKAE